MLFTGPSNVLSWNHNNDGPILDGAQFDIQTVQDLCISKTYKFPSNEPATIDGLLQVTLILDDNTPANGNPTLIDVKAVVAHDSNKVRV